MDFKHFVLRSQSAASSRGPIHSGTHTHTHMQKYRLAWRHSRGYFCLADDFSSFRSGTNMHKYDLANSQTITSVFLVLLQRKTLSVLIIFLYNLISCSVLDHVSLEHKLQPLKRVPWYLGHQHYGSSIEFFQVPHCSNLVLWYTQ